MDNLHTTHNGKVVAKSFLCKVFVWDKYQQNHFEALSWIVAENAYKAILEAEKQAVNKYPEAGWIRAELVLK